MVLEGVVIEKARPQPRKLYGQPKCPYDSDDGFDERKNKEWRKTWDLRRAASRDAAVEGFRRSLSRSISHSPTRASEDELALVPKRSQRDAAAAEGRRILQSTSPRVPPRSRGNSSADGASALRHLHHTVSKVQGKGKGKGRAKSEDDSDNSEEEEEEEEDDYETEEDDDGEEDDGEEDDSGEDKPPRDNGGPPPASEFAEVGENVERGRKLHRSMPQARAQVHSPAPAQAQSAPSDPFTGGTVVNKFGEQLLHQMHRDMQTAKRTRAEEEREHAAVSAEGTSSSAGVPPSKKQKLAEQQANENDEASKVTAPTNTLPVASNHGPKAHKGPGGRPSAELLRCAEELGKTFDDLVCKLAQEHGVTPDLVYRKAKLEFVTSRKENMHNVFLKWWARKFPREKSNDGNPRMYLFLCCLLYLLIAFCSAKLARGGRDGLGCTYRPKGCYGRRARRMVSRHSQGARRDGRRSQTHALGCKPY